MSFSSFEVACIWLVSIRGVDSAPVSFVFRVRVGVEVPVWVGAVSSVVVGRDGSAPGVEMFDVVSSTEVVESSDSGLHCVVSKV